MQLVILAAGHGRRFGGLKQLEAVGPNGEAIMDYTAQSAMTCGFSDIVLVVREEIQDEIAAHVDRAWSGIPVSMVCQPPIPGTAQAVLAARPAVHGSFGVANADDLYGEPALATLAIHFSTEEDPDFPEDPKQAHRQWPHLLVAYRLGRTVLTSEPVTRGLCEVTADGRLRRIVEHRVHATGDGRFDAVPLGASEDDASEHRRLTGNERVSMNLWGFRPRLFDELERAIAKFQPGPDERQELLLPDVVGKLVDSGRDTVAVLETTARCIGITHKDDIALVSEELAPGRQETPLGALRGS